MTAQLRKLVEQKYEIVQLVGRGSYGYVSQGTCLKTNKEVALKVISITNKTEYEIIKLIREIQIL